MTELGKEDSAVCPATQRKQRIYRCVKAAGQLSVLAGFLLAGISLRSAANGREQTEPAALEVIAESNNRPPLSGVLPVKTESQPGISQHKPVVSAPALADRTLPSPLDTAPENMAGASSNRSFALDAAAGDGATPAADLSDRAIWLEIHRPKYEVTWLGETFTISHYTHALESDPLYANDARISVPGLPAGDLYRYGFIYGGRGILQQGTGLAENGQYITIDWDHSYYDPNDMTNNRWFFKYGQGGVVEPWKTAATHHPLLPQGTEIMIESYMGEHTFIVADSGFDLAVNQIDIFIGGLTIAEADEFGIKWSKVAILTPIDYTAVDELDDGGEGEDGEVSD